MYDLIGLVYWQGRWVSEELRVLALANPWWSVRRDARGRWVLVR